MQRQEIGSKPVAYKIHDSDEVRQSDEGEWVKREDTQEILDWLRVFVHTVETGATFSSLRSIARVARNRLSNITK